MNNKKFRIRSKSFFLTYPQLPKECDLIEEFLNNMKRILKTNDFFYVASVELHEDGNPHLHAYLSFSSPQGVYSSGKFDIVIGNEKYHGNYQAARSEHSCIQYIIKAVDDLNQVRTNMELPLYLGKYYTNIHEHLYDVLINEGQQAAIDVLFSVYSNHAVQRGSTLLRNLELAHQYNSVKNSSKIVPKYCLNDFGVLPKALKDWLNSDRPISLLLYGPSGTGKTELAKALMHYKDVKVIFVRDKQALKHFRFNFHGGIIFDDIGVDELSREELIHLFDTDNPSQIRILYGFVDLPANLYKIFTTNYPQKFTRNDRALTRRLVMVGIKDPIFLSNSESLPDLSDARVGRAKSTEGNNRVFVDTGIINKTEKSYSESATAVSAVIKKRGRPVGSKNVKK